MRPIVIAAVLAAFLVALLAVNKDNLDDESEIFLFIETQTLKNGTILNGTPGTLFIDAPTYDLRNSSLRTVGTIDLNSSIKALYGSYFEILGDIGSGVSSGLHPVIDLPYDYDEIHILQIDGDNATLNCYGENITLLPGNSWRTEKTQPEEIGDRLLDVTTTVTVYNRGNVSVKVNG